MLTQDKSLRLLIEFIFVLLGGLIVWLGLTGHIFFDRRRPAWLILSIAILLWGARALYRPGNIRARWEDWTRGISMLLLGADMALLSRAPFAWVGRLLALAGVLLLLRGVAGSMLVFRRN
ncbi:MAG TPA: hypothetical protein VKB24_07235 [Candidatus Acidoferrum sp.]|nr:hypothetical protein [Candidatus Acidoferrum sp.]